MDPNAMKLPPAVPGVGLPDILDPTPPGRVDEKELALDLAIYRTTGSEPGRLRLICDRHRIGLDELREKVADKNFQDLVESAEHSTQYDARMHQLRCAAFSEQMFLIVAGLAKHPDTPAATKLRAAESIIAGAGVSRKEEAAAGTNVEVKIVLGAHMGKEIDVVGGAVIDAPGS